MKTNERLGIMRETESHFIVNRAGRQIDLVRRAKFPKDEFNRVLLAYDRNWAVELDFDPVLDEDFGLLWISNRFPYLTHVEHFTGSERRRNGEDPMDWCYENATGKKDAVPPGEEMKNSEAVMTEAEKFFHAFNHRSEKEEKAKERIIEEAKKKAKESGRPEANILRNLRKRHIRGHTNLNMKAEGPHPFIDWNSWSQRNLYINTDHSFFTKLYAAEGSSLD